MKTDVYDLVILNGQVVDVIDEKIEKKNVGINRGKIAVVTGEPMAGNKVIDAEGLTVCPGFIDFHSHVDGNLYSAQCLVRQGGTTTIGGERNINGKNIKRIEEEGFIVNQGFFISQSFTLRSVAGLWDTNKSASANDIKLMGDLAELFLEYGAFGICFGLEFAQGTSYKEILEMAKIARKYDCPIMVHLRKDGMEALDHFDEIISAARETGAKIQILQLMYMVGIGGAMEPALSIIEKAREEGLDIGADTVIYDAYSACIGTEIFNEGWEKEYGNTSVEDLLIASGIYRGQYCNQDLFDYLRKEFPQTLVTAFVCDRSAIETALKKDYVFVSTNAADGPHYPGIGSPEVAGTYPRLIGRYVREKKTLSLIEAVKKITILPARRFGLENVGAIAPGMNADIVIFDYNSIIDKADFIGKGDPAEPPLGIRYVFVNGDLVVKDGNITGSTNSGKFIKRNRA